MFILPFVLTGIMHDVINVKAFSQSFSDCPFFYRLCIGMVFLPFNT